MSASNVGARRQDSRAGSRATPFDFRRPDRIPKSQLRAIHILHDNFIRSLASSLSAYLRSYVIVNLIGVEQLSYAEFLECLPTPTCVAALALEPLDGSAVLEINSSLVFPIIETLLGGSGKSPTPIHREITEIELSVLDSLFRVVLHDLTEAWKSVATINFRIESVETDPKFLQVLTPSEAVVAIAIEIRIGEAVGLMNIAIPSIIVKMSRQKFDQQWAVRKAESTVAEQSRMLNLIQSSRLQLEVRLEGPTLTLEDLLRLDEGDVLSLDFPIDRALGCRINDKLKFNGRVLSVGQKLGYLIEDRAHASDNSSAVVAAPERKLLQ